jgi:23S rRNA pseudouridine1911/1915/1917 synthase
LTIQKISDTDVVYEDNHLIAINKVAGVLVQGDQTGDQALSESLALYLKKKYNKPGNVFAGVIHRIDRPVSGLVLFSKTSKGLSRMNEVFRSRDVQKTYLSLVEGRVEHLEGKLESFLIKDGAKNKSFSGKGERGGYKKAVLSYEVLEYLDNYTLLKVLPLTGRHHQIRVQLSEMGHPIKGDLKYGAKRSNADGSICLHAHQLTFTHPIKNEELTITAPLPKGDIWDHISSQ